MRMRKIPLLAGGRVGRIFSAAAMGIVLLLATSAAVAQGQGGPVRRYLELVGHNDFGGEAMNAELTLDGDFAYVGALTDAGLRIVDVSNPANPTKVGSFPTPSGFPIDVKAQGDVAILSIQPTDFAPNPDAFTGVIYLDVSDKTNPTEVGRFFVPSLGIHNAFIDPVNPNIVYAADSDNSFVVWVVDFGPALAGGDAVVLATLQPAEVGEVGDRFVMPHDLYVAVHPVSGKTLAYVPYWDAGLIIFDVTDPADPILVGQFDYAQKGFRNAHYAKPNPSTDLIALEDEVGFGDSGGGVHLIAVEGCSGAGDTCQLTEVGFWQPASGKAKQGMATAFQGLKQAWFTRDVHNVDITDSFLYAGSYQNGVQVVDISDPSTPREVAFYIPAKSVNLAMHDPTGLLSPLKVPWVWTAQVDANGLIYVSDIFTGIYILQMVEV
jgi:hypothetical protein